ncbi:hydrogenase maturation protease [Pseudonocardia nigra]|uniref:hydrogenase maturation protease n=1 Tax=Pseudonocardia nigra TaxID=1921578 RepID=UPI001C607F99|nr:hydrogenase maturation protease [Pseudonocardia nigra]
MIVAGVGNVFLGDDGFGVEVVRRLAQEPQPDGVQVADFGIRGLHLAYELLEGYDSTILVDATPRGGTPGEVYVVEVGAEHVPPVPSSDELVERGAVLDAHAMAPAEVLALLEMLGGTPGRVLVLGCEPAVVEERMGLSEPVAAAVDVALGELRRLIGEELTSHPAATVREGR